MCVGGDSGDASLLELSNSLVTCTKAEKVCTNLQIVQAENAQRASVKYTLDRSWVCHLLMPQTGDDGDHAGQGEQEGEDIVGNSEGGQAEGLKLWRAHRMVLVCHDRSSP